MYLRGFASGLLTVTLIGCGLPPIDTKTTAAGIFFGTRVVAGDYPWLVKTGNCSGALIGPQLVLTAAHCYGYGERNAEGTLVGIEFSSPPVRIGHPDYSRPEAMPYAVGEVILHPEYIKLTVEEVWGLEPYDLALLRLEEPVYLEQYLRLPSRQPIEGEIVIAAGWGLTEDGVDSHARETRLEVRARNACFRSDEKRFCTRGGPENRRTNIGSGDSGGPVFVDNGEAFTVLGTNSTSNGDANNTFASQAATFAFIDWILEAADGAFYCPGDDPANGCIARVDECAAELHDCSSNGSCQDLDVGFSCACNPGYVGDGVSCTDLDECADGLDNCSSDAVCLNEQGGFSCACNPGYEGDGVSCEDVDECADGADNCSPEADCSNTVGGFSCTCTTGFSGDGITCVENDDIRLQPAENRTSFAQDSADCSALGTSGGRQLISLLLLLGLFARVRRAAPGRACL